MKPIVYFDRARGETRTEPVHAATLLHWLYNTRTGALAEALLCRRRHASRLYGWLQRQGSSRRRMRAFAERMQVDLTESARSLDEFASFADFFTRTLKPGARPLPADPSVCAAPVDGKVLVYPRVEQDTTFRVKRHTFNLARLLGDRALAQSLDGGAMAVCRLHLADYHHVHFPDAGVPEGPRGLAGTYHAGGPYAQRALVPFFENHRVVTPFRSQHFGTMALVEVGAFTVGSIRQGFRPGAHVMRGQEKSWFEPGGSTVVLVFPPRSIRFDADLVEHSARDLETFVRCGGSLGRAPRAS